MLQSPNQTTNQIRRSYKNDQSIANIFEKFPTAANVYAYFLNLEQKRGKFSAGI